MAMVNHFTELLVWQKADALAHMAFSLTESFPVNHAHRSVREVQDLRLFAVRRELIPVSQHQNMTEGYEDVHRILNGLTRSLRVSK